MSESVFLVFFIVLQLISTVRVKISQNSYLHEFCAQVSQIVFLADLTVFAAYYNCMSEIVTKLIFLDFCAQKSKIVFLADLTVLLLITTI